MTPADQVLLWVPQLWVEGLLPDIVPGDPVFILNGNIQVHVGATDG